jgi:hypothetical protein
LHQKFKRTVPWNAQLAVDVMMSPSGSLTPVHSLGAYRSWSIWTATGRLDALVAEGATAKDIADEVMHEIDKRIAEGGAGGIASFVS